MDIQQDYKLAGDGVMRNKETNNVVATGKVTDAFLVGRASLDGSSKGAEEALKGG